MRVLGIDFGRSRIGVAIGETQHRVTGARPLLRPSGTLERDADAIEAICRTEACDSVVVGVPFRADGRPGELAKACLQLAEKLRDRGLRVQTVNEAGTTVDAERTLKEAGVRKKSVKRLRDSEAARHILERFFDEFNSA